MKKVVRLTESDLHRIVNESVKTILKESFKDKLQNFGDDIRTKFAYAKSAVKDYLPPIGMENPSWDVSSFKFNIECMEKAIQNKEICRARFLCQYIDVMELAKEKGYVKYYKKMKQLYDQMVEMGLYEDERYLNPMSLKDIYADLDKRIEQRGGHFHG